VTQDAHTVADLKRALATAKSQLAALGPNPPKGDSTRRCTDFVYRLGKLIEAANSRAATPPYAPPAKLTLAERWRQVVPKRRLDLADYIEQ
jgi:hypothetical protein